MRLVQRLLSRMFARKSRRRLSADEKVRALEFVIADIEAQGRKAGFIKTPKKRQTTTDEKLHALDRLIAHIEARAKEDGYELTDVEPEPKPRVSRGRRLTLKEKLRVYDRVIADMEAKAKQAGYTAYLEEGEEI